MVAASPSDHLHQTKLRLAVGTVYYAVYRALTRSNADLLIGPSEAQGETSEWNRVHTALGGDSAHELMPAGFSERPEAIRWSGDAFLAVHRQRLLEGEDPMFTSTAYPGARLGGSS